MSRLSFLTTLALLLATAPGCTRRASRPCSALPVDECRAAGCTVEPGCCGGTPQCAPLGAGRFVCGPCFQCQGLSESDCKANAQCRADYCTHCDCGSSFVGCASAGAPPPPCPAIACTRECSCGGRDQQSCIAGAASLGCTPFYCPDCHGGQQFSQCLGPNQGVPACPAVCASDDCRGDGDCVNGERCLAPGEVSCGICRADPSCTNDGECGAGQVCDFAPCPCTPGRMCVPGCTGADQCREGEACSNHHCVPRACASPTECPPELECVVAPGQSGSQCQRRACRGDAECDGGYCVDGACYAALGVCAPPAQ